jgi:hypothetical protein
VARVWTILSAGYIIQLMETNPLQEALARLHKIKTENAELAKTALPKILSASRTIGLMVTASEHRNVKRFRKDGGFEWHDLGRVAINELKRPPVVLTAQFFKKNEEK